MKNFLFIHGGPGLNSFPERALLSEAFTKTGATIEWWNEPSSLRPEGPEYRADFAYTGWTEALENAVLSSFKKRGPVHLIGHSFATGPVTEVTLAHPEKIASLILLAPSLDLAHAFANVMRIAAGDFDASGEPEKAAILNECASSTQAIGDEAALKGLELAAQDPALFTHYWKDSNQMQKSFAALTIPEAQPDIPGMFQVLKEMNHNQVSFLEISPPVQNPTLILTADSDEVVHNDHEWKIMNRVYANVQRQEFAQAGHFLHLDHPERAVEVITRFAAGVEASHASQIQNASLMEGGLPLGTRVH